MRKIAMAGAAALLLAGCGSTSGSPVAVDAQNELFDPCNVPDDSLRAAGVDPISLPTDYFGDPGDEWARCLWSGPWYLLFVDSTTITFDDIKSNPTSTDFERVVVGDRDDAVTYRSTVLADRLKCDVAFPWTKGTVVISVDTKYPETPREDPCLVAVRTANSLDDVLPR